MAEKTITKMCELCGKPIEVRPRVFKYNEKYGRNWGRFHKKCAAVVRNMGSRNGNYLGGRAYRAERVSKERRAAIQARDNHRCRQCGCPSPVIDPINGKKLDVHHDIPVRDGGPDTDNNLVSLCRRCHMRLEHGREKPKYTTELRK